METTKFKDIFLVMDYWKYNLRSFLDADVSNYSKSHVEVLVYNLLSALNYFHSANVLHRDIKPSNIMVTPECEVRICDFGLSRTLEVEEEKGKTDMVNEGERKQSRSGRDMTPVAYSRWYRPPEVILCSDYGAKADMWSIGCVISELAIKVSSEGTEGDKKSILFPGKSCYPISPCPYVG